MQSDIQLCLITNDLRLIKEADDFGSIRMMVDLESHGKSVRQKNHNLFIANHAMSDVANIRSLIKNSELMVRVNPIYENSNLEISNVIKTGADIIMLPMWKTQNNVLDFLNIINKTVKVNLLLETKEALNIIDEVVKLNGIDEIYIGLNDLKLSLKNPSVFDVLANDTIDYLAQLIKCNQILFGFGGIAPTNVDKNMHVPPSIIIGEHVRLNSQLVIVSRKVSGELERNYEPGKLTDIFINIYREINYWKTASIDELNRNHLHLKKILQKPIVLV